MDISPSQYQEAKILAEEIIHSFETGSQTISEILMKTIRLSRLLKDADAEMWLQLEIRGYPPIEFNFSRLDSCTKYAVGTRYNPGTKKYWVESLPQLEARSQTCNVDTFISRGYPVPTINSVRKVQIQQLGAFESIKSSIHQYVVDVHSSLSVGEFAEDIFDDARDIVDTFLRENCPDASKQLVSVQERMRDSDPESYSQALTTCRRILNNVADVIFPPRSKSYVDGHGIERKVGKEEYVNRLLAFIEENIQSGSTLCILDAELNHLAARLDAVYKKTSKGVHDDVTRQEAELTIIHMYLFLAEIARINQEKTNAKK